MRNTVFFGKISNPIVSVWNYHLPLFSDVETKDKYLTHNQIVWPGQHLLRNLSNININYHCSHFFLIYLITTKHIEVQFKTFEDDRQAHSYRQTETDRNLQTDRQTQIEIYRPTDRHRWT